MRQVLAGYLAAALLNLCLLWLSSDEGARYRLARQVPSIVRLHNGARVAVEEDGSRAAWWVGLSLDDRVLLTYDDRTPSFLRGMPVVTRLQPPVSILN